MRYLNSSSCLYRRSRSAFATFGVALLVVCPDRPALAARRDGNLGAPVVGSTHAVTTTATCDPPGPPPRFGCQWSVDVCDWVCAVCDPFGSPPRPSCHWDGNLCNWICPGYSGGERVTWLDDEIESPRDRGRAD